MPCDCPGGGGSCPARAADVAATAPPEPSPVGWGSIGFSCPPPPPVEEPVTPGGRPVPTPEAGTPAQATISWREMAPKTSASPWKEEGGEAEGGDGDMTPPPPLCGRPGGLPAPVAPAADPPLPPPALALPSGGGRGAGGKGRRSSPHPSNIPEPLRLCAPPIKTQGGGSGGSPGWRAHSRDAVRALRVARSCDEDRERGRLRPRGGSRTGGEATAGSAGSAPAGGAGCSHARIYYLCVWRFLMS